MLRKEIKSKFQLLAPLFWSKFQVFHEKGAGKVLKLDGTLAPPGYGGCSDDPILNFNYWPPLFWSKFEVFHEKVAGKVLKLDETLAPPAVVWKLYEWKHIVHI